METILITALASALVTFVAVAWPLTAKFATKKEVAEGNRSMAERVHNNLRDIGQLRSRAEHIHTRDQITQIVHSEAPWLKDRSRVLKQVDSQEARIATVESTCNGILQSLARIETILTEKK